MAHRSTPTASRRRSNVSWLARVSPPIPLHGLRHTHATVGLSLGVPAKVISERLGHEDVAFTLKQYAHVLPGMQADAARRIASAVIDDEEEDVDKEEEPDLVDEGQENEEESGST